MADMDWQALMSSEVFRNYMQAELIREASEKTNFETKEKEALKEFERLKRVIEASPKLKETFRMLKKAFLENDEYREQANPAFVHGVYMLNLD